MRFHPSKRGVSPLIATILLIAFAVALGSVIMNWGLSLSINSDDPCQKVALDLREFNGAEACYGNRGEQGYINFIIENQGSIDVSGVSLWLTGQKKSELIDLDSLPISKRESIEKVSNDVVFSFNTVGNLDQVQFIPKISTNGKMQACTRQAVQPSALKFC